jgi:hypothetical protein
LGSTNGRTLIVVVTMVALFGAGLALQLRREAVVAASPSDDYLYSTSGRLLDRVALSFDALAADLYWIRTIQYFGGMKRIPETARRYDLLYPLLDITTTLDPHFIIAYRFGAIFLAEAFPNGPGRPDLAIRLLEKGIAADPRKWQYYQDIGFVHYWWRHDYKAAASWFARAAQVPGASWWLKPLSATTLAQGGDRSASRRLWQALSQNADNEWLRREADRRLKQLDALDALDRLVVVLERYVAERGAVPASWSALTAAGYLAAVPLDPAGTPFVLDPAAQTVSLSPRSPLFPLPGEPPALPAPDTRVSGGR